MVILGIDPGSLRIGYGVIAKKDGSFAYLESGLIRLPKRRRGENLTILEREIESLVKRSRPDRVGLEKLFFIKNRRSAIAVAEARGVILKVIAKEGVPLFEVSPTEVKLAVTGDGRAAKYSVAKMIGYFLKGAPPNLVADASDALAVALTVSGK